MKQAISLCLGLCVLLAPVSSWAAWRWKFWESDKPAVEEAAQSQADSETPPDTEFESFADDIRRLYERIIAVETRVQDSGIVFAPRHAPFFQIFNDKLLPQLNRRGNFIMAAVTGGTQVGKTTVTNELANHQVSAPKHTAGATKHTVLVVPEALADETLIQEMFPDQRPTRIFNPDDATLEMGNVHMLYWYPSHQTPKDIIVSDTADVDSENRANWEKAERIARAADVVIAVTNKSKYFDERCLAFFRKVREAGKPVIIIFNEVSKGEMNRREWVDWLAGMTEATGIKPYKVYVVAKEDEIPKVGELKVYPVLADASGRLTLGADPTSLLANLRGADKGPLRRRAQAGALKNMLHGNDAGVGGVHEYLGKVSARAERYRTLLAAIGERGRIQVDWPSIPGAVIKKSWDQWWDDKHRSAFVKDVMGMANFLEIPWKAIGKYLGKGEDPEAQLRRDEQAAIDVILQQLLAELNPLLSDSTDLISNKYLSLLTPGKIATMLAEIRKEYADTRQVKTTLTTIVENNFPVWEKEHKTLLSVLRHTDLTANGLVRPAVTVGVPVMAALSGPAGAFFGGLHMVVSPLSAIVGGSITSKLVSTTFDGSSELGVRWILREMDNGYAESNVNWVIDAFRRKLQPIIDDLTRGAMLDTSDEYKEAATCAGKLTEWVEQYHP